MVLKGLGGGSQEPLGRGADGPLKSPYAVRSGPCRTKQNGRWLHCLDERAKCEPLCQFCVSWHTLSWSVPAEIAEMAETGSQTKTWIYADFIGLSREKNWCCQTGLNCRPLHYQWSALPLSYGSVPDAGISQKAPTGRADPCHKAPARASARLGREVLKKRQNQGLLPANGLRMTGCGPMRFPIPRPMRPLPRSGR